MIAGLGFLAAVVFGTLLLTSSDSRLVFQSWTNWTPVAAQEGLEPVGTAASGGANLPASAPDITLEAIERLLGEVEVEAALLQAQVWQQMLRDYRTPEDDPRLVRLQQIIVELGRQLVPLPVDPPAFVAEFRGLLQELRSALTAEDIPRGRVALGAEQLFAEHPEELDAYGGSLNALKHRFRQQELLFTGRERIGRLLEQAEQQILGEQATEAAESIAEAMFLALRTPMDDAEFEERSATVKRLERDLRFARGKRAVQEAAQCQTANDLEARNRQLQVAFKLLPDLPAARVEQLLAQANDLATQPIANPQASAIGSELTFRDGYEEALRFYGQLGMLDDLADRCNEAYRLLQDAKSLGTEPAKKIGNLILSSLEFEVGDLLTRSSRSEEVVVGLSNARSALDKIQPWQNTSEWRFIDSSLRSKSNEVATLALQDARKLAQANDLAAAVRLIEPAIDLAGVDLKPQAEQLLQEWRAQLVAAARLAAEDESWSELSRLSQARRYLEAWQGLQEFEKEYPNSPRLSQRDAIRARLRPLVDTAIGAAFRQLDAQAAARNWPAYRETADMLAAAPLSSTEQQRHSGNTAATGKADGRGDSPLPGNL